MQCNTSTEVLQNRISPALPKAHCCRPVQSEGRTNTGPEDLAAMPGKPLFPPHFRPIASGERAFPYGGVSPAFPCRQNIHHPISKQEKIRCCGPRFLQVLRGTAQGDCFCDRALQPARRRHSDDTYSAASKSAVGSCPDPSRGQPYGWGNAICPERVGIHLHRVAPLILVRQIPGQ